MSTEHSPSWIKHLFRYAVASGDMYYDELGLRDVILRTDEQGDFRIRGEMVGGDTSEAIELCQIFLEYAMHCYAGCEPDAALCDMEDFAQQLGHSIGQTLKENTYLCTWDNPIDHLLEHLFRTLHARISVEASGAVEKVTVIDCPLENAAEHSGLRNIELAHHGMNIMCRSLIQAIDPQVLVETSADIHPEFAFTILKPEFA